MRFIVIFIFWGVWYNFSHMSDYGEINLIKIEASDEFWAIMDELVDDGSGFVANRGMILDAYSMGNLFGLCASGVVSGAKLECESIFCDVGKCLIPCFCVKDGCRAILIWTHTRARNRGFAKRMVELLEITTAYFPIPDSIGFWEKCGINVYGKCEGTA
jgi:hypothetical protein